MGRRSSERARARFFMEPKEHIVSALLTKASGDGEMLLWEKVEHPQLGSVEIGGIDYLRTIRNPPLVHLPTECEHTFSILDKIRMSLPKVQSKVLVEKIAEDVHRITMHIENQRVFTDGWTSTCLELKTDQRNPC